MSRVTEVDLALGILDHQLLDSTGANCGKVDDLEIAGLGTDSPHVSEILVGGGAWRGRGALGGLLARVAGPAVHVAWSMVGTVSSAVTLVRPAAELRLNEGDRRWAPRVGKVPGS